MIENSNRYETSLPFKDDLVLLLYNYELYRKPLTSLYKALKNDPELLETYGKMFEEQLSFGIIEEIYMQNSKPGQVHYLSYHSVIHFGNEIMKVRAVFDVSAKVKGKSNYLTDCLHKGLQLAPLIFDILLRFRCYAVAPIADMEKAFL